MKTKGFSLLFVLLFAACSFGQELWMDATSDCSSGRCTPVRDGVAALVEAQPIRSVVSSVVEAQPVRSVVSAVAQPVQSVRTFARKSFLKRLFCRR